MNKKEKVQRDITHGSRSQIAMEELQEVCAGLEADVMATFNDADIHDIEGLVACKMYLRVLEDIKSRFDLAIQNGHYASKELIRLGAENPTH